MTEDEIPEWERKQAAEDVKDEELLRYLRHIGAASLAAELNDLRFRNRVVEAQRFLDTHEAEVAYQEQLHDKIDARLIANQSHLFDKSQAYMNFIVTLGYAGFFTIWNFVKDHMNAWDMKLVAVLLGVSLMIFIVWTLATMILVGQTTTALGKILRTQHESREEMIEAISQQENKNNVVALNLQRFWLPTFLISVITGFLAGIFLLALLLADIIGAPFSLQDAWGWLQTH